MPTTDDLRALVNASGYVFQLAVQSCIETGASGWSVLVAEHPWCDRASGEAGYTDLVLASSNWPAVRLVVECKRTRGGDWVFLQLQSDVADRHQFRARCRWAYRESPGHVLAAWDDFHVGPKSEEAAFCAIRGSGERDEPMLERTARKLLSAVEAIAQLEASLPAATPLRQPLIYVPVIVTNAILCRCRYHSEAVELRDGNLPNEGLRFEEVPFLRFRKSLATELQSGDKARSLKDVNEELTRAVFIVRASELASFLGNFSIGNGPLGGGGLWTRIAILDRASTHLGER